MKQTKTLSLFAMYDKDGHRIEFDEKFEASKNDVETYEYVCAKKDDPNFGNKYICHINKKF